MEHVIGENLAKYRAFMSQGALADHMRYLGFPWVQSTVSAIESGKRPLRLSEASAVAAIVGISVESLLMQHSDAERMLQNDTDSINHAFQEAVGALQHLSWLREVAGQTAVRASENTEHELQQADRDILEKFSEAYATSTISAAILSAFANDTEEDGKGFRKIDGTSSDDLLDELSSKVLQKEGIQIDLARIKAAPLPPESVRASLVELARKLKTNTQGGNSTP